MIEILIKNVLKTVFFFWSVRGLRRTNDYPKFSYILKRVDGLASFRLETFKIKLTEEDERHSKNVEINIILRKQEG